MIGMQTEITLRKRRSCQTDRPYRHDQQNQEQAHNQQQRQQRQQHHQQQKHEQKHRHAQQQQQQHKSSPSSATTRLTSPVNLCWVRIAASLLLSLLKESSLPLSLLWSFPLAMAFTPRHHIVHSHSAFLQSPIVQQQQEQQQQSTTLYQHKCKKNRHYQYWSKSIVALSGRQRCRPMSDIILFSKSTTLDTEIMDDPGIGIGIDLGTTFSAVAWIPPPTAESEAAAAQTVVIRIPEIIPLPGNGRTMPSVVTLEKKTSKKVNNDNNDDSNTKDCTLVEETDEYIVHVGQSALALETADPVSLSSSPMSSSSAAASAASCCCYRHVKRIIGTGGKIQKEVANVVPHVLVNRQGKTHSKQSLTNQLYDAQHHPTLLRKVLFQREEEEPDYDGSNDATAITLSPLLISSHVLKFLKTAAEEHSHRRVDRAVIGVPAYFNDAQRQATIDAAQLAGIQKVKLLREPEAAALAYGLGREQLRQQQQKEKPQQYDGDDEEDDDELVLVFDLGGGTYDVSMLLVGGGVTEVISTSGNVQLGGTDFDRRIAQHLIQVLKKHSSAGTSSSKQQPTAWSQDAKNAILRLSERIRIHLSNNRFADMVLPLDESVWLKINDGDDRSSNDSNANKVPAVATVVLRSSNKDEPLSEVGVSNSTHVSCRLTRRTMERLCRDEFQALLRPLREVAIMAGALLPGDTSPSLVAAALAAEEEYDEEDDFFDEFYKDVVDMEEAEMAGAVPTKEQQAQKEYLLEVLDEMDMRSAKKAQQKGRKRARNVAKSERKYREEKRKLQEKSFFAPTSSSKSAPMTGSNPSSSRGSVVAETKVKVRDGISGRPISRVVLVGGATRMPAIGRLLSALTGVVPQKTVNPDEAVALGCAIHVGILDANAIPNTDNGQQQQPGAGGISTVLNPMQAAIVRALAEREMKKRQASNSGSDDDDDGGGGSRLIFGVDDEEDDDE